MLVIGLTGGIGSGKTTVARLFEKKGIAVIDTDKLAREVVKPDQIALKKIIEKFGPTILSNDKTLNRTELRKLIFSNNQDRLWLEQLLHPLIYTEMQRQIASATSPYCIAVIPLLIETGSHPLINRILVVDATEEEQIERTTTRDHLTNKEIKAILNTQISRDKRLAAADDIIYNHDANELEQQVDKLHQFYLTLC
jgi:dephospho-CoA kinase